MPVYIDDMYLTKMGEFRRRGGGVMRMSHMVADTRDELLAVAEAIGVDARWIQKKGSYLEHFDICKEARDRAVALSSAGRPDLPEIREVTMRDLMRFCMARRPARRVAP